MIVTALTVSLLLLAPVPNSWANVPTKGVYWQPVGAWLYHTLTAKTETLPTVVVGEEKAETKDPLAT
jgi:hypothetical protein